MPCCCGVTAGAGAACGGAVWANGAAVSMTTAIVDASTRGNFIIWILLKGKRPAELA